MARSPRMMRLIAGGGGAPAVCYCGCTTWRHDLTTFPLRHVSRCEGCGREVVCEMKASPPKPKPPAPPDTQDWPGPFWY